MKPVTAGRADTMGPVCCNYELWDRYSIIYPKTATTPPNCRPLLTWTNRPFGHPADANRWQIHANRPTGPAIIFCSGLPPFLVVRSSRRLLCRGRTRRPMLSVIQFTDLRQGHEWTLFSRNVECAAPRDLPPGADINHQQWLVVQCGVVWCAVVNLRCSVLCRSTKTAPIQVSEQCIAKRNRWNLRLAHI